MKMDSAAVAKGHKGQSWQLAPRDGTRLRRLFDLLMANKGAPIEIDLTRFEGITPGSGYSSLEQLQSFYGLDIRRLARRRWVLAGEWFGPTYRDYIADRLASHARRAAQ